MRDRNYLISIKMAIVIEQQTDGAENGDGAELGTGEFMTEPCEANMLAEAQSVGDLMLKLRGSWEHTFKIDGVKLQQAVLINVWELDYMTFKALKETGMSVFTDCEDRRQDHVQGKRRRAMINVAKPFVFFYYLFKLDVLAPKLKITWLGLAEAALKPLLYIFAAAACWSVTAAIIARTGKTTFWRAANVIAFDGQTAVKIAVSNLLAILIGLVSVGIAVVAIVCAVGAAIAACFVIIFVSAMIYSIARWLIIDARRDTIAFTKRLRAWTAASWERVP